MDAIAAGKNVNVTYNKTTNILGYSVFGADGKTEVAKAAVNLDSMEDFDVQGLDELGTGAKLVSGTTVPDKLTWVATSSTTLTATDTDGNVYDISGTGFTAGAKYTTDTIDLKLGRAGLASYLNLSGWS